MIHVGFRGTSKFLENRRKRTEKLRGLLRSFAADDEVTLHHSGCIGADVLAHDIAKELGMKVVVHPASGNGHYSSDRKGDDDFVPCDPTVRTRRIVKSSDVAIYMPNHENGKPSTLFERCAVVAGKKLFYV